MYDDDDDGDREAQRDLMLEVEAAQQKKRRKIKNSLYVIHTASCRKVCGEDKHWRRRG